MITHRYHMPYYQEVAVFFWPILFFELWRVDRWQMETGRQAFVVVDRYGRAWVPYWERMSRHYHLHGMVVQSFTPSDVEALCPGWLARARVAAYAIASWDPWTTISFYLKSAYRPSIPDFTGIVGSRGYFEPG